VAKETKQELELVQTLHLHMVVKHVLVKLKNQLNVKSKNVQVSLANKFMFKPGSDLKVYYM